MRKRDSYTRSSSLCLGKVFFHSVSKLYLVAKTSQILGSNIIKDLFARFLLKKVSNSPLAKYLLINLKDWTM